MTPSDLGLRAPTRPDLPQDPASAVFEGVRSHLEVQYAWPPGYRPLVLDLHVPDTGETTLRPVVVFAHGGGFSGGTRKRMGPWVFLLAAGYAVACVDYRLSAEAQFPGAVHDVAAAIRWVRAHAGEYGLNEDQVIGFGASAGGYLVNAVALAGDDPGICGQLGPTPALSCRLAAVIDHYAPADFLCIDQDAPENVVEVSDAAGSSVSLFLGFVPSTRPAEAERASLLRYASSASPPFLIAHGDRDRRVGIGQSRRLHQALLAAGARADLVVLPGANHAAPEFDQQPLHETTLAFLSSALGRLPAGEGAAR